MRSTLLEQIAVLRGQIQKLSETNDVAEKTNDTLLEENRRLRLMLQADKAVKVDVQTWSGRHSSALGNPELTTPLPAHSSVNPLAAAPRISARAPTLMELAAASPSELESPP